MRKNLEKPARVFKMPYQISCTAFFQGEEERQSLALGLKDGAIVVLDLALGLESHYVEKHPAAVTTLAWYEDKVLMSGSVDGRVNLCDLDSKEDPKRIFKAQNCMDRKIPVAQVVTSDFGIGAALDIEGNCRFYDLIRLRKICKISSAAHQLSGVKKDEYAAKWRMLPRPTLITTPESFMGVIQTEAVGHFNLEECITSPTSAEAEGEKKAPAKKGKEEVVVVEEEEPLTAMSEKDMLVEGLYSDTRENLMSLSEIERNVPESLFVVQKSSLNIFRFEDAILNVYNHLAKHRRHGKSIREVF